METSNVISNFKGELNGAGLSSTLTFMTDMGAMAGAALGLAWGTEVYTSYGDTEYK